MEYQEHCFTWPHTEPNDVIVTGSFDQWQRNIHMNKFSTGFVKTIRVPHGQKIHYKFIVDGKWMVCPTEPTDFDERGNQNNYFYTTAKPSLVVPTPVATSAPPLPIPTASTEPVSDVQPDSTTDEHTSQDAAPTSDSEKAHEVVDSAPTVVVDTHEKTLSPEDDSKLPLQTPTFERLANTITAADGVTSPLGYVASGIGAAIEAITGVDPINPPKIPIDDVDVTHEAHNEDLSTDPIKTQGGGPLVDELVDEGAKPSEFLRLVPDSEEPVVPAPSAQTTTAATTESSDASDNNRVPLVPLVPQEHKSDPAVVDATIPAPTDVADTPQVSPEVVPEPVAVPPTLPTVAELPTPDPTPATEKTLTPEPVHESAPAPTHAAEESTATGTTQVAETTSAAPTSPTTQKEKAASIHGPETEQEKEKEALKASSSTLPKRRGSTWSSTWSRKGKHSRSRSTSSSESSASKEGEKDEAHHHKKRQSWIKKLKHKLFD